MKKYGVPILVTHLFSHGLIRQNLLWILKKLLKINQEIWTLIHITAHGQITAQIVQITAHGAHGQITAHSQITAHGAHGQITAHGAHGQITAHSQITAHGQITLQNSIQITCQNRLVI